jgi:Htaa
VAHLDWEIKASLLMYVMGAPGGRIVQDDAVGGTGASFHFPLDPERSPDPTADATLFAFTGSVIFIGHFGSFVGEVADIEVTAPADGGPDRTMSIRDREADVRTVAFRLAGAPELSDDGARLTWKQVELTDDGAKLWGGSYPTGTPFEPLTIDLSPTS